MEFPLLCHCRSPFVGHGKICIYSFNFIPHLLIAKLPTISSSSSASHGMGINNYQTDTGSVEIRGQS